MANEPCDLRISNVIDLTDRETLKTLLLFCGEKKWQMSDYELFSSLCAADRLLIGHPIPRRLAYLLDRLFGIDLPVTSENCNEIWRRVAAHCLETKITLSQCKETLSAWRYDRTVLDERQIASLRAPIEQSFFDGNSLCLTAKTRWCGWRDEMEEKCNLFWRSHTDPVRVLLPSTLFKCAPSLYSVENVLNRAEKTDEDRSLLLVQTLRFLCEKCRRENRTLHLRIECEKAVVLAVLQYLFDTVGLPALVWSAKDEQTADAILNFLSSHALEKTRCALYLSDYPTDDSFLHALAFYAERYPIGRAFLLGKCKLIFI